MIGFYDKDVPPLVSFLVELFGGEKFEWKQEINYGIPQLHIPTGEIFKGDLIIARYFARRNISVGLVGNDPLEQTQVDAWIDSSTHLPTNTEEFLVVLKELDWHLKMRTHFVGYLFTLADFAVWAALLRNEEWIPKKYKNNVHHLIRWWDYCNSFSEFQSAKFHTIKEITSVSSVRPSGNPTNLQQWKEIIMEFMNDPTSYQFSSAPGLSGEDRKCIHQIAEELNLWSESKGEGKYRVTIIVKESRDLYKKGKFNSTLMRKFRDDFNLKINLCEENDFQYFVSLYNAEEKLKWMLELVDKYDPLGFVQHYSDMEINIANAIIATDAFKRLQKDTMKSFEVKKDSSLITQSVYQLQNDGKYFISLDLKSANFNSMRYYDPSMVLNANTWDQLLSQFTEETFFHKSKSFRQKVFWLLDATKINQITYFLISKIIRATQQVGITNQKIWTMNDEMIFCVPEFQLKEKYNECCHMLNTHPDLEYLRNIVHIKPFRLQCLSTKNHYFAKEIFTDLGDMTKKEVSFQCVPVEHYALCYKHYFGLPFNEKDFHIAFDSNTRRYIDIDINDVALEPVKIT